MLEELISGIGNFMGGEGGGRSDFANILGSLMQMKGANKIANSYAQQPMTPAEQQANDLYKTTLDPNSQQMQSLTSNNQQNFMESFLSQIRAMQIAQRRQESMGRQASMGRQGTFFNPERADEVQSFLTQRAMQEGLPAAQEQARATISNAASGMKGLIPSQLDRQQKSYGMYANKVGAKQAGMSQIMGTLFPQQQQGMNPNGTYNANNIQWY